LTRPLSVPGEDRDDLVEVVHPDGLYGEASPTDPRQEGDLACLVQEVADLGDHR